EPRRLPAWEMAFLVCSLCHSHPEKAFHTMRELPAGARRDEIIGAVAGTAKYRTEGGDPMTIRPELMLDLLELIQDEGMRTSYRGIMLNGWATAEPLAA